LPARMIIGGKGKRKQQQLIINEKRRNRKKKPQTTRSSKESSVRRFERWEGGEKGCRHREIGTQRKKKNPLIVILRKKIGTVSDPTRRLGRKKRGGEEGGDLVALPDKIIKKKGEESPFHARRAAGKGKNGVHRHRSRAAAREEKMAPSTRIGFKKSREICGEPAEL